MGGKADDDVDDDIRLKCIASGEGGGGGLEASARALIILCSPTAARPLILLRTLPGNKYFCVFVFEFVFLYLQGLSQSVFICV